MSPSTVSALFALAGLFFTTLMPPMLELRESWVGPVLLAVAAAFSAAPRHRKDLALLSLGLIPVIATALAGHWDAFGSARWLLMALLLFRLGQDLGSDEENLFRVALALSLGLLIQAPLAWAQIHAWTSLPVSTEADGILSAHRAFGTFVTPNIFAAWLMLCIPFWAASAVTARLYWRKAALLLASALGILLLAATRSAGGALALGIALFVSAIFLRRLRKFLFLSSGTTLAILIGILLVRDFTWLNPASGQDLLLNRWLLWHPAMLAWLKAPLLGQGPAGAVGAFRLASENLGSGFGDYPHQLILGILLKFGLIGLGCATAAFALIVAQLRRGLWAGDFSAKHGLSIGVLAVFIQAQWEMSLDQPVVILIWALGLGVIVGAPKAFKEGEIHPASPRYLRFIFGALLALAAWKGGLTAWQWPLISLLLIWVALESRQQSLGTLSFLALLLLIFISFGFWWSIHPAATLELSCAATLAFLLLQSLRHEREPFSLALYLAIASGMALLFLASGCQGADSMLSQSWIPNVRQYFPNQNLLAGAVMVPALLLCLGAGLEIGTWKRVLIPALLTTAAIAGSGSRGALAALLGGAAWLAMRLFSARRPAVLAMLSLILLLGAGMFFMPGSKLAERLAKQGQAATADPYFNYRFKFWKASAAAASERWELGWGLGTYQRVMESRALDSEPGVERLVLEHAHNSWLELAVEAGWPVALSCLLATFWIFLRWSRQNPGQGNAGYEAAIAALLIHAIFDFEYSTPWCWLLGIGLLAAREPVSASVPLRWPSAKLAAAFLAVILFCGTLGNWLTLRGKAESQDCGGDSYTQALELRPYHAEAYARLALLQSACFESGQDSRGLFRGLRHLASGLDRDPGHSKARTVFCSLLHEAAIKLSESNLQELGNLMPGWQALARDYPQSSMKERFEKLSLNVQAK